MMKEIVVVMVLLTLCVPALAVDMPNMVGNWTGTVHGIDWSKYNIYSSVGKPIYWDRTYILTINEQNGTRFSGNFTNAANPSVSEVMLGVIGSDNKTIALVDELGSYWGTMNSSTEMELFGSVVDQERKTVGVGTFTKK